MGRQAVARGAGPDGQRFESAHRLPASLACETRPDGARWAPAQCAQRLSCFRLRRLDIRGVPKKIGRGYSRDLDLGPFQSMIENRDFTSGRGEVGEAGPRGHDHPAGPVLRLPRRQPGPRGLLLVVCAQEIFVHVSSAGRAHQSSSRAWTLGALPDENALSPRQHRRESGPR